MGLDRCFDAQPARGVRQSTRRTGAAPGGRSSALGLAAAIGNHAMGSLLQRDLAAYNTKQSDVLSADEASSTVDVTSAEAPGIRAALASLIAAGKVREVESASGDKSWFAADFKKNVTVGEIRDAFAAAGYKNPGKMARSLADIHHEYLYSADTITSYTMLGGVDADISARVTTVHERSLTEYEITQAKRVFKGAISYDKVRVNQGSISARIWSVRDTARTIGHTINFPTGSKIDMPWLVHELTHVWQYETVGWTYAPSAVWAQLTEGYSYSNGKTPEQALKDARAAGKVLTSFNKEQQGDILADYMRRLQKGEDASAWQPFVDDVK
ncbi:MAG TPA: hypothetical protein VMA77_15765 [Solirubrobacteraceae bacterium]|nr:hypothetical protein [Solirubrobacteraceae bacterium]